MVFTNYNHPVTDKFTFSERQMQISTIELMYPQKVPTKAETGSKLSSFVNQYLPRTELVDYVSKA